MPDSSNPTGPFGERARAYMRASRDVGAALPFDAIQRMAETLVTAYRNDRQVIVMGNGGSAALASHIAVDFSKGTAVAGRHRFRVSSIVDNTPIMTAYANDVAYADVFAEQIRTLVRASDVVFAISGSGNSRNVVNGLKAAREAGASTILLTGFKGGECAALADVAVIVPSDDMQQIEDAHLTIAHALMKILCDVVREDGSA